MLPLSRRQRKRGGQANSSFGKAGQKNSPELHSGLTRKKKKVAIESRARVYPPLQIHGSPQNGGGPSRRGRRAPACGP